MKEKLPPVVWYRQRWPWLLMSIPLLAVIVGSYLAYQAVSGQDPVVEAEYYTAGQNINKTLKAGTEAAKLGLRASVTLAPDGRTLDVQMKSAPGVVLPPVLLLKVRVETSPVAEYPVNLLMTSEGHYRGELPAVKPSAWTLALTPPGETWHLSGKLSAETIRTAVLNPTLPSQD